MSYVVRVLMTEDETTTPETALQGKLHVDGQYEYGNLEIAREAAQVACNAAARLRPARSKAISDEEWTEHPDRTDD